MNEIEPEQAGQLSFRRGRGNSADGFDSDSKQYHQGYQISEWPNLPLFRPETRVTVGPSRDGFVELGWRDFGGGNPLVESQQTLSDLRGNVAVVHHMF